VSSFFTKDTPSFRPRVFGALWVNARYVGTRFLVIQIFPVPGPSVSFCRVTRYCSGESVESRQGPY
jgi:hypothetical protein